jgi:hypothetical protein
MSGLYAPGDLTGTLPTATPTCGTNWMSYPGRLLEDPRRKKLIEKIAAGFDSLVPEGFDTAIGTLRDCYGCLWLADLEKPESLVTQYLPHKPGHPLGVLNLAEEQGNITDRC